MKVETLETPRLQLLAFERADEEALAAMMGDPEVMKLYGGGVTLSRESVRYTLDFHLHCRSHDYWAWAIRSRDDGRFIGSLTAGFTGFDGMRWLEPAWIVARSEWGCGFATEAAKAFVNYALKQLHWKRLRATANQHNSASLRVIEKAGFTFLRTAEVRPDRLACVFVFPDIP